MYNPNDPTQVAALKAELQQDPKALGYAALFASGDMAAVARVLSQTYPAAGNVQLGDVPTHKVRSCVSLADWTAMTPEQRSYMHFLLDGDVVNLSDGVVDDNLVKGVTPANPLGGIWAPGNATLNSRSRLNAMKQRKATRAEELFGLDTVIGHAHVSAAWNS